LISSKGTSASRGISFFFTPLLRHWYSGLPNIGLVEEENWDNDVSIIQEAELINFEYCHPVKLATYGVRQFKRELNTGTFSLYN